jgi:hypothetical protein
VKSASVEDDVRGGELREKPFATLNPYWTFAEFEKVRVKVQEEDITIL